MDVVAILSLKQSDSIETKQALKYLNKIIVMYADTKITGKFGKSLMRKTVRLTAIVQSKGLKLTLNYE